MSKIEVLHFRVYDVISDDFIIPERKSTVARINLIGGQKLEETREVVGSDEIDPDGKHIGLSKNGQS